MTFLNFYTLDVTHIVIISLTAFVIFTLINYFEENKEEKYTINLTLSIVGGVILSILYSYFTIEPDVLLTSNYWD